MTPPRPPAEYGTDFGWGELEPEPRTEPFVRMSHDEVLALKLPDVACLIDDLVEAGSVGTIAGVPETYKSFLAQAIAVAVATGCGEILGRRVVQDGPVGYFWQDDSRRNEVTRIKLFEQGSGQTEPGAQVRWFLNENLLLPDRIARLRATVETYALRLLILDSSR